MYWINVLKKIDQLNACASSIFSGAFVSSSSLYSLLFPWIGFILDYGLEPVADIRYRAMKNRKICSRFLHFGIEGSPMHQLLWLLENK